MDGLSAYQEDLEFLVNTLQKMFEANNSSYSVNEQTETLYIQIEGLEDFSDDEIFEIANPVLDELDMDFEEIILTPLS